MNAIIVDHCASVTPRSTQQRESKPLFQPGLVVSTVNAFRRGHCIELVDITPLLIKICSGNFNVHQKLKAGHVMQSFITISKTFLSLDYFCKMFSF